METQERTGVEALQYLDITEEHFGKAADSASAMRWPATRYFSDAIRLVREARDAVYRGDLAAADTYAASVENILERLEQTEPAGFALDRSPETLKAFRLWIRDIVSRRQEEPTAKNTERVVGPTPDAAPGEVAAARVTPGEASPSVKIPHRVKITAALAESTYRTLEELARQRGTSMANVLRDAIELEKFIDEARRDKGRLLIDRNGQIRELVFR